MVLNMVLSYHYSKHRELLDMNRALDSVSSKALEAGMSA